MYARRLTHAAARQVDETDVSLIDAAVILVEQLRDRDDVAYLDRRNGHAPLCGPRRVACELLDRRAEQQGSPASSGGPSFHVLAATLPGTLGDSARIGQRHARGVGLMPRQREASWSRDDAPDKMRLILSTRTPGARTASATVGASA
jgi:hypothetical protein